MYITLIERKSRMPQIQGVQGRSRSTLLRSLGNVENGVSAENLVDKALAKLEEQYEEKSTRRGLFEAPVQEGRGKGKQDVSEGTADFVGGTKNPYIKRSVTSQDMPLKDMVPVESKKLIGSAKLRRARGYMIRAAAAIDRLVHHSIVLELNLPSYRLEHSKKDNNQIMGGSFVPAFLDCSNIYKLLKAPKRL